MFHNTTQTSESYDPLNSLHVNLSSNSSMNGALSGKENKILSNYIEPLMTFYFLFFIAKIYRKDQYNFEPIHLFTVNILGDCAVHTGRGFLSR